MRSLGLDFGTTNSAVAEATADGPLLARYPYADGVTETFRSVLFFAQDLWRSEQRPLAGPLAMDAYLATAGAGRLVQSLKSYLADRGFDRTNVFGRSLNLTEMLAFLLLCIRGQAERDLGPLGARIVVGRPVRFSNAETEADDAFAIGRLREALGMAGFDDARFALEPVAAAYFYERTLDHDELILVGDFGGGTSDFTVARVGPSHRGEGSSRILATDGVALAGDAIDGRIVEHVIAPALGLGSTYKSIFGKTLDVPVWLYEKLRKWHHLSFLKDPRTLRMLAEIEQTSSDAQAISALVELVESDLGFQLYRAVERTKIALSSADQAQLTFELATKRIDEAVTRDDLERWITKELARISASVDRVLAASGASTADIDRVFLTGGTSFVPAVRRIFSDRFGAEKLSSGGEMISVAGGLSLMAREGAL